jgi:predicted nucleotidyltransferase component of viral defense system
MQNYKKFYQDGVVEKTKQARILYDNIRLTATEEQFIKFMAALKSCEKKLPWDILDNALKAQSNEKLEQDVHLVKQSRGANDKLGDSSNGIGEVI